MDGAHRAQNLTSHPSLSGFGATNMMRHRFHTPLALAGILAGVLAYLAPPAPAAAPQKVVTVEGITEYHLDNGLRILLFPDPSSAKVTVNQCVLVGSRMEGYGEAGMAHLLEHMNFKGTPNHPQIPKDLRDKGAQFNATTSLDRTNYFETLNASDDNLDFALNLESDRLVNSLIRHEDLATEMTVVRNEFERGENTPSYILSQRLMSAAYQWHNYSKSTIGNRSDIERVPIANLQDFYHKWYQPDNVVLIICGNFDPDKALALITKYYAPLPKPTRVLPTTWTEEPPQDGDKNVVLRRVGTVGLAGLVYHVPAASHPDFAPLEVLAAMLDAEPSGALYKALVETKKASTVNSFAYPLHDPGVFGVDAQVDKSSMPEAVRDALIEVMENLGKTPAAAEEVDRAKTKIAKQYDLMQANSNGMARILNEWTARGDWRLFYLDRDAIAKVTPADVTRVSQKYFIRSNRTAGVYLPTDKPDRADVPETPDIAKLVESYKGGETIAAGEFFDPTPENIEKRTTYGDLPSGIKTAVLPKKTRGTLATFELTLRFGNADSLKGQSSAAQLLGTLMTRGTKKHSRQEIEDTLDKLKARITAGSSAGQLSFNVECKHEAIPQVLNLLTEMLREPAFPADEFDVIKRQDRDRLEQGRTEPQILAARALQRKLYPYAKDDVRYVPTIEESIDRLEGATLDQVRKLYDEQVSGAAGEFVAVGDFDAAPVLKQMGEALKDWKSKTPYKRIERAFVEGVKAERIVIETPDKANAVYMAGLTFPLSDADPENPALEVADYIFGSGTLSSRLGVRVRQKEGLSYGITSRYGAESMDKSASLQIQAICNPKNIDKVDVAVLDETDKMLKSGVTDKEADEAKTAYLASRKVGRTSDGQIAGQLRELLHVGRTFAYEVELEKQIAAVSATQVSAAFKEYVSPAKLVIVEAGDFKKGAPPEK
jgi:zinc protease